MASLIDRLLSLGRPAERPPATARAASLVSDTQPAAIYAIGDVHGCLDLLQALEREIVADARGIEGERWIVMIGDVVDRGASSAHTIDHLLAPPPEGFRRLCLMGNHEAMMLGFLARPRAKSPWLDYGGRETLLSYGIPHDRLMHGHLNDRLARQLVEAYVPSEHLDFLASLPLMIETPESILVHAGLRPGISVANQAEADLIGYRDDFSADFAEFGKTVVHGHMIRDTPLVTPGRIAIDTGAYASGRLTAVRLMPGAAPQLLSANKPRPVVAN